MELFTTNNLIKTINKYLNQYVKTYYNNNGNGLLDKNYYPRVQGAYILSLRLIEEFGLDPLELHNPDVILDELIRGKEVKNENA